MGTTPNFSWPYPESSDYVADGATAIENLADAVDTTVESRAKGVIGWAVNNGTTVLSNVISIQDIPNLSIQYNFDADKLYLFHVAGYAIQDFPNSPAYFWADLYVRDSGTTLRTNRNVVHYAYGNEIRLLMPYQFATSGTRTLVASVAKTATSGTLNLFASTDNPWTFEIYELGDN